MTNRVHISRQGSVDVTSVGDTGSNLHLSTKNDDNNNNLTTQELLQEEPFSGTVTFRDRAKNAIERTLSPGSEFSFSTGGGELESTSIIGEGGEGSRLVDIETGVSLGKLENLLRQQAPDQVINDYTFGMTKTDKSERLKNLETELLQTKKLFYHYIVCRLLPAVPEKDGIPGGGWPQGGGGPPC